MLGILNNLDPVNRSHPLASGLVSWYLGLPHFAGTLKWPDLGQVQNTGVISSAGSGFGWTTSTRPGGFGAAMRFDGTATIVDCTTVQGPSGTVPMSFAMWVRSENLTGFRTPYFYGNNVNSFGVLIAQDGTLNDGTIDVGNVGSNFISSVNKLAVSTWAHLCLTYDGTTARLYFNGKLDSSAVAFLDPPEAFSRIGSYIGSQFWQGQVDDVRVYWRTLSGSEVRFLYDNSIDGCPGLINQVDPQFLVIQAQPPVGGKVYEVRFLPLQLGKPPFPPQQPLSITPPPPAGTTNPPGKVFEPRFSSTKLGVPPYGTQIPPSPPPPPIQAAVTGFIAEIPPWVLSPRNPWRPWMPTPTSPPTPPLASNPLPTPPVPPARKLVKTIFAPLIQRDPTQDQPLRRFTEIVADCLNSLFTQGIIAQTGPSAFTIVLPAGSGAVTSFNGRSGAVTFALTDLGSPAANQFLAGTGPVFRTITPTDLPAIAGVMGSYTSANISVDQFGRVTTASSGSSGTIALPAASTGGIANAVLFNNNSNQITTNAGFLFDGTTLTVNKNIFSNQNSSNAFIVEQTGVFTKLLQVDTANGWVGVNGTISNARFGINGLASDSAVVTLLGVTGTAPTSVGTSPGTAGPIALNVFGSQGGDSTATGAATGGAGSAISIQTGRGGQATAATTTSTGGGGGQFSLTGSPGGNAALTGAVNNTGGQSTLFSYIGAAGGSATGATSGTNRGGPGGGCNLNASNGGTASGSSTSNIGGASGGMILGSATAGSANGAAGGTATGGNGSQIQILGATGGGATGSATTNAGGSGANIVISAGNGGNASGGATNNGGAGGGLNFSAGTGGSGSTAAGANGGIAFNVNFVGFAPVPGTHTFFVGGFNKLQVAATFVSIAAGGGTGVSKLGGTFFSHFADAGNTTTTETDLYSDTIQASTLATNGDTIEAKYACTLVNSTSTKQVRVYFGGTVIFDSGALTISASSEIIVNVVIMRDSSTSIRYSILATTTGASTGSFASVGKLGGLTLSNTNILKITGQAAGVGAATNDIVAILGKVEWRSGA